MKTINGQVLNDMLNDIKKMDFITFLNIYVPTYIDSETLQERIEMYKETGYSYILDEAKQEFNILLFQSIPNTNNFLEDFAYWIQEDNIESLSIFLDLYKEYDELSDKKENEKFAFFKNCSNEVQFRFLSNVRSDVFHKYYNLSSNQVQNAWFQQSNNPLEDLIPIELNEDSENYLKEFINAEYEKLQEMLDYKSLDLNATFSRVCNCVKKTPPEIHMGCIEKFIEHNLELFNTSDLEWSQFEKTCTGEVLLELLSKINIKQKDGDVFHLNFETTYNDVQKLIEVSQKYKISCDLTVRSCADLPRDSIKVLRDMLGIDIKSIKFKDYGLGYYQEQPYNLQEYTDCRRIIDTIIEDREISARVLGKNDPNKEKKICGLVVRKLANMIAYNYEFIDKEHNNEVSNEEAMINRNMIGPLLHGNAVCAGYAEVLRNVLLCCGIECRYIGANNVDSKKPGHAWNQVKLDGVWYNLDLTWDVDRIIEVLETKYYLKSDEDFKNHEKYIPECIVAKCIKTEPNTYRYLYSSRINKTIDAVNLMRKAIIDRKQNRITLSEVDCYEKNRNVTIKENIRNKGFEQR